MIHWVSTATLYMEGHAALWLQAFKRHHVFTGWELFCRADEDEFGLDEYDAHMNRLLLLKQTGTVTEYRVTFESCMYHLLALDATLNSKIFVTQFVIGLRDDIRAVVRLHAPTSVTRAAVLARIQEEEMEVSRPRHRAGVVGKTYHQTLHAPSATPNQAGWPEGLKRSMNEDLWRERQLREHRRTNGLYFKCGDKYIKEHICKKPVQLMTIEMGEFGEMLSAETLNALDEGDEPTQSLVQ